MYVNVQSEPKQLRKILGIWAIDAITLISNAHHRQILCHSGIAALHAFKFEKMTITEYFFEIRVQVLLDWYA
jgi:hypothetical protein